MIKISLGPQFSGPVSRGGVFISLFIIAISSYYSATDDWLIGLFGWITLFLSAPLFMDFRGTQIDLENQRVRQYKSYYGIKRGPWVTITQFKRGIELRWERMQYHSGGTAHFIGPPGYTAGFLGTSRTSDNYAVYALGEGELRFLLGYFSSHRHARKFAIKYARVLKLPFKDKFKERLASAAVRRAEIESRRKRKH